jgi:uncharacterized protein (DUF305 family)
MPRITRFALPAAGLLLFAAGLVACGGSEPGGHNGHMSTTGATPATSGTATQASGSAADAAFNDADVSFATGMVPHHAQAIAMADLATDRAADTQVKQLAVAVRAAQGPEITTMSGWLNTWGKPVPPTSDEHAGHDMTASTTGSMTESMDQSMTGMMSAREMDELMAARGPAFDRMWLTMMIKHHQGAIAMATRETGAGAYEPAKTMASAIVTSQGQEIATMQQLLTRLG